jgi:hypothetical protein
MLFPLLNADTHFMKNCSDKKQVEGSPTTARSVIESKKAHKSAALAR